MQNKKRTLYFVIFFVFVVGWWGAKAYLFPPPPAPPKEEGDSRVVKPARRPAADAAAGPFAELVPEPERIDRPLRLPAQKIVLGPQANLIPPPAAKPLEKTRQFTLGSDDPNSTFHLQVVLDARGAGVRRVLLNKFQAVDGRGQPEWDDPETRKQKKLLQLVPEDPYDDTALSYFLYAFDLKNANKDESGEQPLDTLGRIAWKVVEPSEESTKGDSPVTRVVFQTTVGGVVVQKVYTLNEGEYHVGLDVRMFKAVPDDKDLWFRYQLAGAHGLPIEGKWYTNTFRNALIGLVDKSTGGVSRELQDARALALKEGGDEITRSDANRFIRYAAVAIQYFTSAIVVSDEQGDQEYLSRERTTVETAAVKGTLRSISEDGSTFILNVGDKYDLTFRVENRSLRNTLRLAPAGAPLGVIHRTDRQERSVAVALEAGSKTQPLFENDITVRVATVPINLKNATEEKPVVHRYLLYNGPMKPKLLAHVKGNDAVADEVVERYSDTLGLNTLIDYSSPGWMGTVAHTIQWTWLVVHTTNLMHWVLGKLNSTGLPLGLCIIVLTVLVRGMMFPVSRKAAMTNIRMQELQPEMKKLKEKHKDNPQELQRAIWALQKKSGVNPLSTCWLMFLQMPIFMGLYYSLQESIHFRAASFWPTWINNLAAPDMLFSWGESIPFISAPESYGNFIYLGPFFNILPVIAVTLMIFQQKYTMPPPTDEQQEMQQKMMKYMMVFMGLMFYKVPSGLVLYFIASSIWGFTERKLLPKRKPPTDAGAPAQESLVQTLLGKATGAKDGNGAAGEASTGIQTSNGNARSEGKGRNRGKKGKNKIRVEQRTVATEPTDGGDTGSVFQRIGNWWRQRRERVHNWWDKIQNEAQKKNR